VANEVEICNMALSHVRGGSINSLEEPSLQAQQCKLWYPIVRDQVLEDAPWNFAHKLKALAVLTDEIFNWAYVYQYPSDCLRINHLVINWEAINNSNSAVASRIYDLETLAITDPPKVKYKVYNIDGNKVIAANDSELRVDYRAKITDPNLYSFSFMEAMSYLIASKVAVAVTGKDAGRALRKDNLQLYQAYLETALTGNANEEQFDVPESESILVRSS